MDIRVFKTFLEVASQRHFGHAAETLYITPAAVSARIKQLEEFYNCRLLIRDKSNLRLTEQGEALLPHAQQLVSQLEESKSQLALVNNQKQSIYIAATPNVWDVFLSSRIQSVIQGFNQFVLNTEISVREAIQRKLHDRTIDFALLTDPIRDEDFECELIGHFSLSLVGTREDFHEDLDDYVLVDWGLTFQKEHASQHKAIACFKTSNAKIAQEYIQTNGGFAYLPTAMITDQVEQQKLFLIDSNIVMQRPIYLISRVNGTSNSELKEQFKSALRIDSH